MAWNIFILSWPSSLKYTSNKIIKMWGKYQTNVERHLSTMEAKSINQAKFFISAQQNVWPHVLLGREPWVEAHDRNTAVRLWFGYESIKGNIDYTRKNILGCITFLDSFIKIPSLRYIWKEKKKGGGEKSQKCKLAKNIPPHILLYHSSHCLFFIQNFFVQHVKKSTLQSLKFIIFSNWWPREGQY